MKKGFAQAGNLIFSVLFFMMAVMAGYLYVSREFGLRAGSPQSSSTPIIQGGIRFIHPSSGYALSLPYSWREKYRVWESEGRTVFISREPAAEELFEMVRVPEDAVANVKIDYPEALVAGRQAGEAYVLLAGPNGRGAPSEQVAAIAASFSLAGDESGRVLSQAVRRFLEKTPPSQSSLLFLSLETLATRETGSSTEYYVWVKTKKYGWNFGRLSNPIQSDFPAAITVAKNSVKGEESAVVRTPRPGQYRQADIKKLFPSSVHQSPVFASGTPEHEALLAKLDDHLDNGAVSYFGEIPLSFELGFISGVRKEAGGYFAMFVPAVTVPSPKTSAAASSSGSVRLAKGRAVKKILLPENLPASRWGRGTSTIEIHSLDELSKIFSYRSTSTWRAKPFWIGQKEDETFLLEPYLE